MTLPELFWNYIIPIYAVMFVAIICFLVIRRWKNKGKIPIIILKPTQKLSVVYRKREGNEVIFPKSDGWKQNPTFKTGDFFQEDKPSWKFWRLPKSFLVIPEFAENALSFVTTMMRIGWTHKEITRYVTKQVLKSRQKKQLISSNWAIAILLSIIFLGFIVYLGFNRIGAF